MKRPAAVAGQFYHGAASRLLQQVEHYTARDSRKEDAVGIMVPHAGLIYSGAVAGAVFSSINFPHTFIMLGPNHTGLGPQISLMDEGEWEIPTGIIRIDRKLSSRIALNVDIVSRDAQAHFFEHSLEVQLPFLSYFRNDVQIVPLAILSASLDECIELGDGIAKAVRGLDYSVVILASSDLSHYLSDRHARQKDKLAIDKILACDAEGLYRTVLKEKISMCGYLPATVMLHAAKLLGATSARLIRYMTSGEVSGDYESVVGYAGIVLN